MRGPSIRCLRLTSDEVVVRTLTCGVELVFGPLPAILPPSSGGAQQLLPRLPTPPALANLFTFLPTAPYHSPLLAGSYSVLTPSTPARAHRRPSPPSPRRPLAEYTPEVRRVRQSCYGVSVLLGPRYEQENTERYITRGHYPTSLTASDQTRSGPLYRPALSRHLM